MQWIGQFIAIVMSLIILTCIIYSTKLVTTFEEIDHDSSITFWVCIALLYLLYLVYNLRKRFKSLFYINKGDSFLLSFDTMKRTITLCWKNLLGCTLTWALFDSFFYGDRAFNQLLKNMDFTDASSIVTDSPEYYNRMIATKMLSSITALPGYAIGMYTIYYIYSIYI